jgi:dipeptidyl aminopeptidase/acylaminoacyl peptidase
MTLVLRPMCSALVLVLIAGCAGGGRPRSALPTVEPPAALPDSEAAVAATPESERYSIEEFLATTTYSGASFSPDGRKILVTSDATGIFNAWAVPVDGGEPIRLTDSTQESVFTRSYFPHDERFLYVSDEGGNELDHLYVQAPDGTVRDLTPGEELKAAFLGWTDDEGELIVATNERDQRYFDVFLYDVETYEREMIFRNDQGLEFTALAPDERTLALARINTNADTDVYLYDRLSGELRLAIGEGDEPVEAVAQAFGPDGRSLYYLTNEGHEFSYLVRRNLDSGADAVVLQPDWDVTSASFSRHRSYLVVGINADARTELRLFDAATLDEVELPKLPQADITSVTFAPEEQRIAFYASSSRMPRDLFCADLGGGEPRQLTRSLNPAIDPGHLVAGEVVRFTSYDGQQIPGILYRPRRAGGESPVPALVWVHGGPGGQSRIGYSALIQYLVNHGYGVYAINNRGSSGYGKTFFHLDDRRHGAADLDDVVAAREWLAEMPWIAGDAIGILGGSYGGYMTLAALTFRPQVFAAGVDLFGISNWHRTVTSIPPWWESFREALEQEMGDFDDEEFFKAKSPLFHAARIERPLMVLQGANDPRVLQVESDEIVAAVRANGVPVEYLVFEDEGHGFVKKENQERAYRAIREFLDLHLREAGRRGHAQHQVGEAIIATRPLDSLRFPAAGDGVAEVDSSQRAAPRRRRGDPQ